MEHPEVAYRLALEHQLELERAAAVSRRRPPPRFRFAALLGEVAVRLARRPASLFERPHARPVPRPPFTS